MTSWIHRLHLTKADEDALVNGQWLSANHINAAHLLLRLKYPQQNGLQDTSYLRDKKTWPSHPSNFIQIICVSDCHWACLSNVFCDQGCVDLYDSLHTIPIEEGSIVQQACTILKSQKLTSITVNVVNVQHQVGFDDCGLYAIVMAIDLCEGRDPFRCEYDQSSMRSKLKDCFEDEALSVFSVTCAPGNCSRKHRYIHHTTVELFCLCRRPELSLTMACCDTCDMWYHQGCIPIPDDVLSDKDDSIMWSCCQCKCKYFPQKQQLNLIIILSLIRFWLCSSR